MNLKFHMKSYEIILVHIKLYKIRRKPWVALPLYFLHRNPGFNVCWMRSIGRMSFCNGTRLIMTTLHCSKCPVTELGPLVTKRTVWVHSLMICSPKMFFFLHQDVFLFNAADTESWNQWSMPCKRPFIWFALFIWFDDLSRWRPSNSPGSKPSHICRIEMINFGKEKTNLKVTKKW